MTNKLQSQLLSKFQSQLMKQFARRDGIVTRPIHLLPLLFVGLIPAAMHAVQVANHPTVASETSTTPAQIIRARRPHIGGGFNHAAPKTQEN